MGTHVLMQADSTEDEDVELQMAMKAWLESCVRVFLDPEAEVRKCFPLAEPSGIANLDYIGIPE